MFLYFFIFFNIFLYQDNIYYLKISSPDEVLNSFFCYEKKCQSTLDFVFPLKESEYLIILNSKKNINLGKVSILSEREKKLNYKIINSKKIKINGSPIFIPFFEPENFNYIFGKDEKGNWKMVEMSSKSNIEIPKNNVSLKRKLNEKTISKNLYSIYLWDTIEILKKRKNWEELTVKLKIAKIKNIYIQIPYKINLEEDDFWLKKRAKKFSTFIKYLIENGFKIEFLDGWKGFALESAHKRVLNQIKNLEKFWKIYFKDYIFPPMHLDIEPYLLRFYNNQNYKDIYLQYINLLKKIKENFPHLIVNLDIPFWLDNLKDGEKILSEILKYSDGINVMAYRSKIYGNNGIIKIIEKEVSMAMEENKKLFIALETMKLENEKLYKIFKTNKENSLLYLHKTNLDNLFFLSNEPSEYGLKIIEETPSDLISLYKLKWEEIIQFSEKLSSYYGDLIEGIAFHHWGSMREKIK